MSFTSLALGTNWPKDEWPEHVNVMHEGARDNLKYVPERTCTNSYDGGCTVAFKCSNCGDSFFFPKKGDRKHVKPKFCPECGAKVIKEER